MVSLVLKSCYTLSHTEIPDYGYLAMPQLKLQNLFMINVFITWYSDSETS